MCDGQCAVIRTGPLYYRPVVWISPANYDDDYDLKRGNLSDRRWRPAPL